VREAVVRLEDLAADLAADRESPRPAQSLRRRRSPLASPAAQLEALNAVPLRAEFDSLAAGLAPSRLEIFQVNLGKLCNMTCRHCHVDAGPDRTDAMMDDETVER
jgi:sulfatase maturation enzyme AslB (radical SAM superfamily)